MGSTNRNRRSRAIVDVDDLIIRADNIVVVGDRNRPARNEDRVAGMEDIDDIDDDMDNVEIRRHKYYQDNVLGVSEEIQYYGSKRIDF
ncbi:hypothetical protein [Metabacillus fastidiosus]|uniref:Uncharacterized protein n=1 Tax=Metabacillus fastidiosus TaxID=1458 RepID=A0ABU6NXN7_9BACI|nr:hypothetical protein [Metabacillus fastidiosus]MED4401879.1 hypothetical protein [Metabacillus fastidiosus]MED4454592.1 hypothetical protein [Metabacillus fastidiosus]MED4460990.1 hypothetical protein [Metabacillus fastidiosus]